MVLTIVRWILFALLGWATSKQRDEKEARKRRKETTVKNRSTGGLIVLGVIIGLLLALLADYLVQWTDIAYVPSYIGLAVAGAAFMLALAAYKRAGKEPVVIRQVRDHDSVAVEPAREQPRPRTRHMSQEDMNEI